MLKSQAACIELNPLHAEITNKIKSAVGFDLKPVANLIEQVGSENKLDNRKFLNHGGLCFLPFNICWFEIYLGGITCFMLEQVNETDIAVLWITREGVSASFGLRLIENNYVAALKGEIGSDFIVSQLTSLIASSLIVLNAPYGIKRETPPIHKGQAKKARREGFELKPHHIITLDKTKAPPSNAIGVGGGSPKAFHFVRSHRRLIDWVTQRYTIVKAHWRGDPRLGIHHASYKVKA